MATMGEVEIYRAQHDGENPYVPISKASIRDNSLSLEALGLLVYLLSLPDTGWKLNSAHLQKERRIGRDKLYRLLAELESTGYLQRVQQRDEQQRFTKTTYRLYETPQQRTEPFPENPYTAEPYTENQSPLVNNESLVTNECREYYGTTRSARSAGEGGIPPIPPIPPALSHSDQNDDKGGNQPDQEERTDPLPTGSAYAPHPTPLPPSPLPAAEESTGDWDIPSDEELLAGVINGWESPISASDEPYSVEDDLPYRVDDGRATIEPRYALEVFVAENTKTQSRRRLTPSEARRLRKEVKWIHQEYQDVVSPAPVILYQKDRFYREWVEEKYREIRRHNQKTKSGFAKPVGRKQLIDAILDYGRFYRWRYWRVGQNPPYQYFRQIEKEDKR